MSELFSGSFPVSSPLSVGSCFGQGARDSEIYGFGF